MESPGLSLVSVPTLDEFIVLLRTQNEQIIFIFVRDGEQSELSFVIYLSLARCEP